MSNCQNINENDIDTREAIRQERNKASVNFLSTVIKAVMVFSKVTRKNQDK